MEHKIKIKILENGEKKTKLLGPTVVICVRILLFRLKMGKTKRWVK
jgi:hypothetical protein